MTEFWNRDLTKLEFKYIKSVMQLKMCVKIDGARQIGSGSFTIGKVNGNGINNSKGGKIML